MKSKILIIVIILTCLTACERRIVDGPFSLKFYPRKVNFVDISVSTPSSPSGDTRFVVLIRTNNHDDFTCEYWNLPCDERIPALETQIGNYFGWEYHSPYISEYRTDGVTQMKIYTPDATIFGKASGESLNENFEITELYHGGLSHPYNNMVKNFIASYQTKTIVYKGADKYDEYLSSIEQWLALEPLAAPVMTLKPKSIPTELPATLRLIVEIKTTEGKTLRDTTQMTTLNP